MEMLPPISASLGAMGSLSRKLDALLDTELKDEIGKLGSRLLKLSKPQDPPLAVRIWMNEVRELSYDMVNCVDTDSDWIDKMSGFKARVKEANGRYDRYKLESVPTRMDIVPIPTVVGGRKPDLLVGLRGAFDKLCNTLTDGDKQLKVLSVVGVGGIGKTTLAKQLWRKHKRGDDFDCRAFVRMSKKPDMRRILRSILAQVRPHQPSDANEVHDLIRDLTEHLKDKRYFLIIDDLWATSVWDVAIRAFPEGSYGSRIITTTEIEDVALACCSYQSKYILKMEPLSDSHSKELFSSAVFGSREQHSHQDEVSDEIIRRCAGLPQAIISISSVLSSHGEENNVESWEQIQNFLPNNTTSDEILKQVLNFCYDSLPSCVQTCLLYLSMYPENYIILKEDIVKQWVVEGFICESTEIGEIEVAESYFDKLVDMGLIQEIDVNYNDEVLYYAVSHMVHDIITTKSIEENFLSVIDYSQRMVRFSDKVSHLSIQFGSATYAPKPPSIGLSQVRSLAYTGLSSCLPPHTISEFKFLRLLILHIWDDQPSTGVDLRGISELLLLRYLQVRCNNTVHLPAQLQGLEHLETLEINARVAAIPLDIVHLQRLLHLRLGEGTKLPDVTGVLKNDSPNPPSASISFDESSSPPESLNIIEILLPIFRIPKWIGHLTKLCVLKIVVRELPRSDISNMKGLPSLTVLSLHVQGQTTELIGFATGAFSALEYFEFRCGALRLMFHEGAMPNLQRLKLGFNAHRGEQYGGLLLGIEHLSNVKEISGIIWVATGAEEHNLEAAESSFKKAMGKHPNVSIKRVDMVEKESGPAEKQHAMGEKDAPSHVKSEQPAVLKQESEDDINQNADHQFIPRRSNTKEVANVAQGISVNQGTGSGAQGKVNMEGFGMSHQQALAQVTAQASHSPLRMFDHTEQPSFSAAATSSGALQNMSSAANVTGMSEMAATISNNEHAAFHSAEASHRYQVPAPVDKPADDGYNWRKYGQKVVKGSDCPRSYYKCTHPSCPVKKKVEHAEDGQISEIIYKGKHNHQRPPNKRAKDGSSSAAEQNEQSNDTTSGLSGVRRDQEAVYGMSEQLSSLSDGDDKDDGESQPDEVDYREGDCKRRNIQISSQKALTESKIIVQTTSEVDLLDDGYRWRKYGQKVVKGNPHPRSYYKCTFAGCNVRKHIERASSDPKAVITTYEGKHNHEPPVGRGSNQNGGNSNRSQQKGTNSMSSNQASHTTDINQGQVGVLQFKREE